MRPPRTGRRWIRGWRGRREGGRGRAVGAGVYCSKCRRYSELQVSASRSCGPVVLVNDARRVPSGAVPARPALPAGGFRCRPATGLCTQTVRSVPSVRHDNPVPCHNSFIAADLASSRPLCCSAIFADQAAEYLHVLDSGSDVENVAGLAKGEVPAAGSGADGGRYSAGRTRPGPCGDAVPMTST
jgi:hypothetical protein